jgi:hypothetical protein
MGAGLSDIVDRLVVEIGPKLLPHADAAIVRLSYLYPDVQFSLVADTIEVFGVKPSDQAALKKEVAYAVYRERIYRETLDIRKSLAKGLFGG